MADPSHEKYSTVIGADATFKGELQFESAAKVLGRFEGSITSKGAVQIADGSDCKATISAREVSVEGRVEGNVEAADRIEITPTGIISGDIVAARMTMAEGASINGHCRIGPNGQHASKASSTAEAKPAAQPQQPQQVQGKSTPAPAQPAKSR